MSLSRWSNSVWYIYQVDLDITQVEGVGHWSTEEIRSQYSLIDQRVKSYGYSSLERIELYLYLKTFAKIRSKKIDYHRGNLIFRLLRNLGRIKIYLKDPYSFEEGLPPFEKLRESKRRVVIFPQKK